MFTADSRRFTGASRRFLVLEMSTREDGCPKIQALLLAAIIAGPHDGPLLLACPGDRQPFAGFPARRLPWDAPMPNP
jgi:hypothetical protein